MSIGISESWKGEAEMVNVPLDDIRKLMGITSPSKKLAEIGRATGEDFSKGINKATSTMKKIGTHAYTFKCDSKFDMSKVKMDFERLNKDVEMLQKGILTPYINDAMRTYMERDIEITNQIKYGIEKEKKEMENRCGTCKHEKLGMFDNPCNSCCRYSKWEQKDILSNEQIKNVIFNPPATVVFWKDGTKTVVKAEGEEFDPEKGLAMAFSKKFLGNKYEYYNTFKHWLKKAPGYKKEK